MNKGPVVEIDGCRITPEFVQLIKDRIFPHRDTIGQFKTYLFDTQSAILIGMIGGEVPSNLDSLADGLQNLYRFCDELESLILAGKF